MKATLLTRTLSKMALATGLAAIVILAATLECFADAPALTDPSQAGTLKVKSLTYGSAMDRHRDEYGAKAGLISRTVDASALLPSWSGKHGKARTKYWGFGPEALPLNGRVWYPDGNGPFPLVLMVHGNHNMKEFSDPGYAYLGELLASRGYIAVSVDENFLNGGTCGDFHGAENLVRAWLLLKHLELWNEWNVLNTSPFYLKVNMDQLALIGHSRGGEAAATAAALNRLKHHPDNALIRFDFGFDIQSVVAIAPADGQYRPSGRLPWLDNVNYLVLQGSHDSDVSIFLGSRQYQRVRFSGDTYRFKAGLYIYRANHGQFNTVWGRKDLPIPSWMLNLEPLLDGEEQRQIAKLYISAFLEATLRGRREYVPLFRDPQASADWLPATSYISQFEDSHFRAISTFEEDIDVTTATLPGAVQRAENLTSWSEGQLRFRTGMWQDNNGAYLGWNDSGVGSYAVQLPEGVGRNWGLSLQSHLVFSMADGVHLPGANAGGPDGPFDLSVELVTSNGIAVRVPLSWFSKVPRAFEVRFTNWRRLERKFYVNSTEPVMQRFELPLSAFSAQDARFDPAAIRTVRFVFDRGPGAVILDDLGFRI